MTGQVNLSDTTRAQTAMDASRADDVKAQAERTARRSSIQVGNGSHISKSFIDRCLDGAYKTLFETHKEREARKNQEIKEAGDIVANFYSFDNAGRDEVDYFTHILKPKEAAFIMGQRQIFSREQPTLDNEGLRQLRSLYDKYFDKKQLFENKFEARNKLKKMWVKDAAFEQIKYDLLETSTGRAKVSRLYDLSQHQGEWASLKEAYDFLSANNKEYHVKYKTFLGLFKKEKNFNGSYVQFLKMRKIIGKKDIALLEKFNKQETYLNHNERKHLATLRDSILGPVHMVLTKRENLKEEAVLTSEELDLIKDVDTQKLKERPDRFSSRDVSKLSHIYTKYFGSRPLYQAKKEALSRFDTLMKHGHDVNKKHRFCESPSIQRELAEREAVYERKGVWKDLQDLPGKFRGTFNIDALVKQKVLLTEDGNLLSKFFDSETPKHFNAKERNRLERLYNKLIPYATVGGNQGTAGNAAPLVERPQTPEVQTTPKRPVVTRPPSLPPRIVPLGVHNRKLLEESQENKRLSDQYQDMMNALLTE